MRPPLPISLDEFARLLQRAKPPTGWSGNIVVANSGGPDSTCLLFLIHRHFSQSSQLTPSKLVRINSVTVDHGLQPASSRMAEQSSRFAASLDIPHTTVTVPWNTPPFPPRPRRSQPFESIARTVRYNLLWNTLLRQNSRVLALGHHADDQVETALMRLGKRSSELGGRGMLPCRRWGMGMHFEGDLSWTGLEGMKRWLVRPLLAVPKDRILATCEEHNLEYVTDPTNFQPGITLRNALRSVIAAVDRGEERPDFKRFPQDIASQLFSIDKTISSFAPLSVSLDSPSDRLRGAIKAIDSLANDIENQASALLPTLQLPSPPSTFILSTAALTQSEHQITNLLLRRALILRIMRYVSFQPWGSLRSQARRSMCSLDQIIEKVFHPKPFHEGLERFVAGAGVLWTPVLVDTEPRSMDLTSDGSILDNGKKIKFPIPKRVKDGTMNLGKGVVGWMASRQPPYHPGKFRYLNVKDTLEIDLTEKLRDAFLAWDGGGRKDEHQMYDFLYDCRFLIKMDLSGIPENVLRAILSGGEIARVVVLPWTRYFWPQVVLKRQGKQSVILHSDIDSHRPSQFSSRLFSFLHPKSQDREYTTVNGNTAKGDYEPVASTWITTSWIRVLDAF